MDHTQEIAELRRTIAWLRSDRERIREQRDLAEIRMIECESLLASFGNISVTVRVHG